MKTRMHFILSFTLGLSACGSEDCDPGIAEGEQFRFTVLAEPEAVGTSCSDEHPKFEPGDSFVLEGGELFEKGHSACAKVRSARPVPPSPWSDVLDECDPAPFQLGMDCSWSDGCGGNIRWSVSPEIQKSDRTIENGTLRIDWGKQGCEQIPVGECTERYPVSIERL